MAVVTVSRFGLRIPKDVAERIGLREGSVVEVVAEEGRVGVYPARPRYALKELVADITHGAMREAFDWGPDFGREIVDE